MMCFDTLNVLNYVHNTKYCMGKVLHYSIFYHCTTGVIIVLFVSYCTSLYCPYLWTNYYYNYMSTFSDLEEAINNT